MKYSISAVVLFLFLTVSASGSETSQPVFAADFSSGYAPQISIQPCRTDAARVQIVDIPGGKALRVGKKTGTRAGRVVYTLMPKIKAQTLANNHHPFPMRFGSLRFRFRPVGWSLKDSGYNMLLRIEGPRGTLLHVIYLRPNGVPSIQVAYGQQKNPKVSKGELPVIYPYTALDASREWHDVAVSWDPAAVTLTVDGKKLVMPTRTLAAPEKDFYAERLYLGYGLANLSLGETDIASLEIRGEEPEEKEKKKENGYPELTVNPMQAPVIDGNITSAEWKQVSAYTGFLKLPKGNVSDYQPAIKLGYDSQNLYIAFQSRGHKRPPVANETVRDGRIWKDDSIELYFSPEKAGDNYYHIIVNHAGTVFDQFCHKDKNQSDRAAWNCRGFRSAARVSGGTRSMEIAIPFATLGMKAPARGSSLFFNICENVIGSGYFSLASVKTRFAERESFGILKFAGAGDPVVDFTSLGPLFGGEAAFRCGAEASTPVKMEITAKRYDQTADTEFALFSEIVSVPRSPAVCFRADAGRLKKNGILYVRLRQQNRTLYAGRFFYEAAMTAEIENLRRTVINGKNHLRIISVHLSDGKSRLRLKISGKNGAVQAAVTVPVSAMKQTTVMDISKLVPGSYQLSGELLDSSGSVFQKLAPRDFSVYGPRPPWHGFVKKNIKPDHVPAPWTPLAVSKNGQHIQVSCWNRCYTFGPGSLFAEQITSSGTALLKAPIRLLLKHNGKTAALSGVTQKIISAGKRRVVIESAGTLSSGGSIKVRTTIDYDGFIWFDMVPHIPRGSLIEHLAVQVDMPKENAALLNCGFRDLNDTGKTPAYWQKSLEALSGPFWVGMEKGGLSFGIESAENWSNKTITSQAEVQRNEAAVRIRLNMVDLPFKTEKAPVYGFYIHPTPVRPRPAGFRQLRAQDWFAFNRTAARKNTFYPANFSWWSTTFYYQGHPDWAVEQKEIAHVSRRLPKEYARNGRFFNYDALKKDKIRSAWYAAYSSIGRNAPEVIWNGEQWFAGPRERLYGNTFYGYEMDMIEVCKTADYCDFYLWCFDKAKRAKPVIDGLYFDLWGAPSCNRKDHGHGYTDKNGTRKAVRPLREHRRWMELIYLYCKEKAQNAPIVCHVSGATAHIAGYSFADYLLDGELWFDKLAQDRSYKAMSFDMARAEILPHIWGPGVIWLSELHRARGYVPAAQQKTWALEPWAMRHFSGLLLLHDVIPDRTSLFETARQIWYALDRFKLADQDEYLPYWENSGLSSSCDGKTTAVTAYLKKAEKRMMLVVFNNNDQAQTITITPDMKKLFGSKGKISVTDLETGKRLHTGNGRFSVPVSRRNFRLLQLAAFQ